MQDLKFYIIIAAVLIAMALVILFFSIGLNTR